VGLAETERAAESSNRTAGAKQKSQQQKNARKQGARCIPADLAFRLEGDFRDQSGCPSDWQGAKAQGAKIPNGAGWERPASLPFRLELDPQGGRIKLVKEVSSRRPSADDSRAVGLRFWQGSTNSFGSQKKQGPHTGEEIAQKAQFRSAPQPDIRHQLRPEGVEKSPWSGKRSRWEIRSLPVTLAE